MAKTGCPHCGIEVVNDGSLSGHSVACPSCARQFTMPWIVAPLAGTFIQQRKAKLATKRTVPALVVGGACALVFLVLLLGAALIQSLGTQPAKLSGDVHLTFDVDIGSGRPTIRGITNLPEGTVLMFSVTDEATDGRFEIAQANSAVASNGTFEAGPFSRAYRPLSGGYIADVTMPYADTQTPAVKAIIGDKGQHLTGPLVKHKNETFGNLVEFKKRFTVGGEQAVARQRQRIVADAENCAACFREMESVVAEIRAARGQMTDANKERFTRQLDSLKLQIDRIEHYLIKVSLGFADTDARDMLKEADNPKPATDQMFNESMGHAKEAVAELERLQLLDMSKANH